jgi:hypothetical protein
MFGLSETLRTADTRSTAFVPFGCLGGRTRGPRREGTFPRTLSSRSGERSHTRQKQSGTHAAGAESTITLNAARQDPPAPSSPLLAADAYE